LVCSTSSRSNTWRYGPASYASYPPAAMSSQSASRLPIGPPVGCPLATISRSGSGHSSSVRDYDVAECPPRMRIGLGFCRRPVFPAGSSHHAHHQGATELDVMSTDISLRVHKRSFRRDSSHDRDEAERGGSRRLGVAALPARGHALTPRGRLRHEPHLRVHRRPYSVGASIAVLTSTPAQPSSIACAASDAVPCRRRGSPHGAPRAMWRDRVRVWMSLARSDDEARRITAAHRGRRAAAGDRSSLQ